MERTSSQTTSSAPPSPAFPQDPPPRTMDQMTRQPQPWPLKPRNVQRADRSTDTLSVPPVATSNQWAQGGVQCVAAFFYCESLEGPSGWGFNDAPPPPRE